MAGHPDAGTLVVLAVVSALARAHLNVVDRFIYGLIKLPIRPLNFINNALPAVFILCFFAANARLAELAQAMQCWRVALLGLIVQAVSYVYSWAFRHITIYAVTIATKVADLFVPFGVLAATGYWSQQTFVFSVMTGALCLPLLSRATFGAGNRISVACGGLIGLSIVCQAALAPLLIPAGAAPDDFHAALTLSASVVLWRTLWGSMSARGLSACVVVKQLKPRYLILLAVRAALTLLTQMTFIVVVTAPRAVTVWPILNSVPFLAILLSALWIKERPTRMQGAVIGSVAAASLVHYVLL